MSSCLSCRLQCSRMRSVISRSLSCVTIATTPCAVMRRRSWLRSVERIPLRQFDSRSLEQRQSPLHCSPLLLLLRQIPVSVSAFCCFRFLSLRFLLVHVLLISSLLLPPLLLFLLLLPPPPLLPVSLFFFLFFFYCTSTFSLLVCFSGVRQLRVLLVGGDRL